MFMRRQKYDFSFKLTRQSAKMFSESIFFLLILEVSAEICNFAPDYGQYGKDKRSV